MTFQPPPAAPSNSNSTSLRRKSQGYGDSAGKDREQLTAAGTVPMANSHSGAAHSQGQGLPDTPRSLVIQDSNLINPSPTPTSPSPTPTGPPLTSASLPPTSDGQLDGQGHPIPRTFQHLVELIRQEMGPEGSLADCNVARVQAIMQNYTSRKEEWQPFAFYDKCRYTRNLVDDGNGKYNLLLLCWGPNQLSPIHDHAGAHCILKVMEGKLVETLYAWPSNQVRSQHWQERSSAKGMQKTDVHTLQQDQAAYMHDRIGLHRVGNPSGETCAVSLHLYSPPINICQTFNEETGVARKSGNCVLFSVKGQRTVACMAGLTGGGDSAVTAKTE